MSSPAELDTGLSSHAGQLREFDDARRNALQLVELSTEFRKIVFAVVTELPAHVVIVNVACDFPEIREIDVSQGMGHHDNLLGLPQCLKKGLMGRDNTICRLESSFEILIDNLVSIDYPGIGLF